MSYPESSGGIIHHVALLPSSGMGHLTPFLRLAGSLVAAGVHVTFISTHPTVSEAESQALSTFFCSCAAFFNGGGMMTRKQLHLIPLPADSMVGIEDPFYQQMEVMRRSCSQLLPPLLTSSSPPLSGIIIDMSLLTAVLPLTRSMSLPSFAFFTSSAKMLTLFATSHQIFTSKFLEEKPDLVTIPGQHPIPTSWIPSALFKGNTNFLRQYLMENGKQLVETDGILINTMQDLEDGALSALNDGRVVKGLPNVVPIGPLLEVERNYKTPYPWLDDQASGSVLYVSFGSRTAMSREQMRELGKGLIKSGYGFIWAVKDKKVDREDEVELREVMGEELLDRLRERGLVLKEWVNQSGILQQKAVGGFLTHCGWNSIMESVTHGVPMLAWPQHGDQRINASLVERSGIGMWNHTWDWAGPGPGPTHLVTQHQIADSITALMTNQLLTSNIKAISTAAVPTTSRGIAQLIHKLLLTNQPPIM